MISTRDIPARYSHEKNLVTDQTYTYLQKKINTAAVGFNATEGLGVADNNSSVTLGTVGGPADQRVTADMKWVAPTVSPNEEIGVLARCRTMESTLPGADYYYARVDGGIAKLTKVLAGAFTNLAQSAFAVPIDTLVTIELTCVGNQITAIFTCGGVAGSPLTLQATDNDISTGGQMGFRSLTSSHWCRRFKQELL